MSRFVPDMYVKDILSINYDKLKKNKIKILLFDFDNTIIAHKVYELDKEYIKLFEKLKKDFKVYIISNSFNSKKLSNLCKELNLSYIGRSLKPSSHGFKKIKHDYENKNIAMVGDQMITDIWGAKRMGYFGILVDPINKKNEVFFTKINRKIEELIIGKINNFKRGDYYD